MKTRRLRKLGVLGATALAAVTLSACLQANQGADWLGSHMIPAGTIAGQPAGYETYAGGPDLSITAETVLAMKATGQTAELPPLLNYLEHHESDYIDVPAAGGSPAYTDAGHVAMLIFVARATKTGHQFGVSALDAQLRSLQQVGGSTPGLFGLNDPSYDGVFRTALALQALAARGATTADPVVASGLSWMLKQQCLNGGFSTDRAANPCSGLASNYQGPDTNTTAQALLALAALHQPNGVGSPASRAMTWLKRLESPQATWPFYPGDAPDSNSSAIVSVALAAQGQPLSGARWTKPGRLWPLQALLGFEDTTAGANFGGYSYQAGDLPDSLSTAQVTLALAGVPVPL
jgi:hypothetical protein